MVRRFLGILLVASMAHLLAAGSDPGCAMHGGHATGHGAQSPMQGMHHHGDAGDMGKDGCKIPAHSDRCEGMTGCSMNAALASIVDDHAGPAAHASLVAFLADAPLTRLIPPDPPPPKA